MKNQFRLLLSSILLFGYATINAQTTGTVFRDYNGNGLRGVAATNNEPLVAGIIVNAYNSSDVLIASFTTTSAAAPNFTIPTSGVAYNGTPGSNTGFVAGGVAIRLEFIITSACGLNPSVDYSTGNGSTVGSSVRFISGGATGVNYAIQNPADYIGATTNPLTFTTRFTNGNPTGGGTAGTDPGFLGFPFNNAGNATPPSRTLAASNMGSIWGLAYSERADVMFTAAYVKRHSGLQGSSGQVFKVINLSSGTLTSSAFFNFDNGIDGIAGNADDIPTRYNGSVGAITYGTAGHYTITGTAPIQTITYNGSTDPISGLPAGLGVIGANTGASSRNLPAASTGVSNDPAAFGQVGRVGLGDIEISDDGQFLYVVNLYDRKLYRLTLNNPANPTAVTAVTSYSLPTPPARSSKGGGFATTYASATTNFYTGAAGGGYQRPFGLKFYRGKVFVSATTTGETGGTTTQDNNTGNPEYTDLWAYVWEFDAATAAFNSSPLLQEPLNFNRGINGDGKNETWKPWTNTFQGYVTTGTQPADSRYYYYAQPMLTGIEFDNDGTMILGFRDRFGDQSGYDQPPLTGVGTGFNGGSPNLSLAIDGIATGDILRVFRNPTGCVFVMETNGSSGSITTTGANNGQGPSNYTTNNGEFYYQDGIERFNGGAGDPALWHLNCGEGALAFLPGDQDVASTKIDPMSLFSNGISKMRNTNGTNPADYELFGGTARNVLGKSNGLGDLEILLPLAPIEIGNRIWNDADGDGIQEPGEAGLANITLELFLDANSDGVPDGAAIGTVTTDATGNYYFTSASGTDVTGIDYGVNLVPNQNYIIRVASSDWDSVTGAGIVDLAGLQLTKTDKVGTGAVDLSDNDASLTSGATIVPQIRITTGNAGQNNHNIDFGFKALASLGDKVWRDDNANGIQDAGEPGVAGVTVTLYNNAGAVISTTVTDAYGNYLFDNLAAGTYQVGFTPPTNYNFTTQTNNTDNTVLTGGSTAANGSDVNASGRTANVVLVAGENERNIDAGLIFTQPATNSIGDRVWFDSDGGGTQNGTEPGVSGVTVTLYASDGVTVIATTVTDANGNYLFTGLPASTNYIVGLTPPAGMLLTSTSGTTPGNATVNSDFSTTTFKTTTVNTGIAGTQITGIDAGLIQQAAAKANLGDKVWIDLSGGTANVQDANEPGLPGVTVELLDGSGASIDPDGAGPLTKTEMVTDAFGNYIFNNLNAATYRVKFTLPSGYTFVTQNSGADDFKDSDVNTGTGQTNNYTISAGQRNLSIDAGVTQNSPAGTAKIGDFVWFDANGNGTQDAGETGVAGVTVTLYNNVGTAIATTTTDANGTYQFVNLAAATYSVGFSNLPAGYSFTSSTGTTSGSGTTNSDANTATGKTSNFVLAAGQSLQGLDAGLVAGISSGLGSLGNKVWWDIVTNNNVQDAGEPGVPGVIVNLDYDINGDGDFLDGGEAGYKSTTTNALGEYLFTGLPAGAYQVRFTNLPTGSSTVTQNSGVNDNIDSDGSAVVSSTGVEVSTTGIYNLAAGEDNLSVDLGIINAAKGSLGNRVWFDNGAGGGTANDGIQNGTEGGVAGVTVTLVNAAGQTVDRTGTITTTPITTTTDANGYYAFADLTAGVSFAVIFSNPPAGFDFTIKSGIGGADDNRSDPNLTSGLTPAVTIVANTFNSTLDAGITSPRAALGNYVWLDTNGDGIQDAAEAGVAGVTVTLYRPGFGLDGIASTADDALPVASMITDQNGQYLFTNLVPGTYQVEFSTIPGGLSFTQQNTPGDNGDNTNSDALPVTGNPSVGRTGNIVLTAGEADLTIDAGLFKPRAVIGNFIWADSNSNGLQDAGEPGLSGVIVTLIDAGGNPVVIAVTDANGGYLFPNVAPGTYSLSFTNLPTGVIFTTSNVGGNDNIDSDVIGTTITGIVVTPTTVNLTYDAGVIGAITLPARLQFTALKQTNAARLIWKVTQEDNVARYELEHSTDGINYVTINNQNRNGSTEYQYLDAQPAQAINFYRVRIIDNNGRVTYSEIRTIVFGKDSQILVFPNPVASGNVNIQLPDSWQNKKITINVMNQLGQIISSRNSQQASQVETVDVSKLSNGSYLLRMSNENGEVEIRKIMVNR